MVGVQADVYKYRREWLSLVSFSYSGPTLRYIFFTFGSSLIPTRDPPRLVGWYKSQIFYIVKRGIRLACLYGTLPLDHCMPGEFFLSILIVIIYFHIRSSCMVPRYFAKVWNLFAIYGSKPHRLCIWSIVIRRRTVRLKVLIRRYNSNVWCRVQYKYPKSIFGVKWSISLVLYIIGLLKSRSDLNHDYQVHWMYSCSQIVIMILISFKSFVYSS